MDLAKLRKIEIEIDGETLAHFFRELPTPEWLAWQRNLDGLNGDGDALTRISLWYDAHVVRVEGYEYNGVDLMVLSPLPLGEGKGEGEVRDWKSLIPGSHKLAAWTEMMSGANLKKKLSTTSTSSATSESAAPEK